MHRFAVLALAAGCGRLGFDPLGDGGRGGDGRGGDVSIPPNVNIAFITSMEVLVRQIGGLAGGDATCNARAAAAGLPGQYVAWLSSATVNARDRLAGSRGWVLPSGDPLVDTVADLTSGHMFYPLAVDELGDRVPQDTEVVTATLADGTYQGMNCSDFTTFGADAEAGAAVYTTQDWTSLAVVSQECGSASRLYCFGIGQTTPVTPAAGTHRRAFVSTPWVGGGGLASADALCASDAANAGLTGTFRALLATTGTTASSRFDLTGSVWARLDGAVLARSNADLMAGNTLTSINITAAGMYIGGTVTSFAWTGGEPNVAGTDADTCFSWTTNAGTTSGMLGTANAAGQPAFNVAVLNGCGPNQSPVYCFEL